MGFETVVRPAVFPNIRPQPTRSLPIADAPDKGLAVITGGSNSIVDLPHSEQHSWSRSRMVEVSRTYDNARVFSSSEDGTVDKSQYMDFEVLRSVEFKENGATKFRQQYTPIEESDNIQVLERNQTRKTVV